MPDPDQDQSLSWDRLRQQGFQRRMFVRDPTLLRRSRHKKEPLPMKLRSLPQSFWQQVCQSNQIEKSEIEEFD